VDQLPHGYTNFTRSAAGQVHKTYDGPRRWDNARRELVCLKALGQHLPIATVVEYDLAVPSMTLSLLPGRHGQDLIEEGHAPQVLRLVGATLARLQSFAPWIVDGLDGTGPVIVHGDFGPQNMLFDLTADRVTGVVDWESAHIGSPIEDLAWTEWLVRMHHPEAVDALDDLFAAAQFGPSWSERQAAMVRQIQDLIAYCESAEMTASALEWRDRLRRTEGWTAE